MVEKKPIMVIRIVKVSDMVLWRWIAESDMRRERSGMGMSDLVFAGWNCK